MNTKTKVWIQALRLRTLPLAAGGILLGSLLPETGISMDNHIFVLALLTAFALQILSNLANDYGDHVKGTDNEKRVGPQRAMQTGTISKKEMMLAMVLFGTIALLSGIALILVSFGRDQMPQALGMLGVGLAAIWASIQYTVGKRAYGYYGLGDVFVMLFFGLVSVWGVSYLYLGNLNPSLLYPALSYGFLATGVLNINNMRDIKNDKESGKNTLVVLMGLNNARIYHVALIVLAFVFQFYYLWNLDLEACFAPSINPPDYRLRYLGLLGFAPILVNTFRVIRLKSNVAAYNPFLKGLAVGALFQALLLITVLNYLTP